MALFARIKAHGYSAGNGGVTRFTREWRSSVGKAPHALVPLPCALGGTFQFDWSNEGVLVGGSYDKMQVLHMKLCASRTFWLVAYPSQERIGQPEAACATFAGMKAARFYFSYFWFSSAVGGREF